MKRIFTLSAVTLVVVTMAAVLELTTFASEHVATPRTHGVRQIQNQTLAANGQEMVLK